MTKLLLLVACVASTSALLIAATPQAQESKPPTAPAPTAFDKYHFVLLATGDNPPELSAERRSELQSQHLGHLTKMAEEGYALVAGPFGDRFDDKWRGIVLFRGDLEAAEVRRLAEADPSVQAGLMKIEMMTWYTGAGALEFPMAEELRAKRENQGADSH